MRLSDYITEGVLVGFMAMLTALFTYKAKRSKHARSFIVDDTRNHEVERILNDLVVNVPHLKIASVLEWQNHDKAKKFRCVRSSDFQTWHQWKEWRAPETALTTIQATILGNDKSVAYMPEQLRDPETDAWFDSGNIKQCAALRIAIDENNDTSLSLWLNYDEKHIVSAHHRQLVWQAVNQLHDCYKPQSWWAKKKYLK
jgi:hypothetical protein